MDAFLTENNFSVRPFAGKGLWLFFLIPIALNASSLRHWIVLTPTYKITNVLAVSLINSSLYIIMQCQKNKRVTVFHWWPCTTGVITGAVFYNIFDIGVVFSVWLGLLSSLVFVTLYTSLLKRVKESFTIGEAGLIVQGLILVVCSITVNLPDFVNIEKFLNHMKGDTIIIQCGFLTVTCIAALVHSFNINNAKLFYFITLICLTLLDKSIFVSIIYRILYVPTILKLFIYWLACVAVTALAVSNQIYYAKRASTSRRKVFHILAVLVYIPGLYVHCSFLYLASGLMLSAFFFLEIIRLRRYPPLGNHLQDGYEVFRDGKDTGILALTPIYLLVGLSLPIWIHPAPCDVTDSAQFTILPLLSGVMTIGIGDTAASFIGSNYGKLKWSNSSKTIEGTLASIFSQLGSFYFLYYLGILPHLNLVAVVKIVGSVVLTSIVEAKTTQIDNLVLPLIMYSILV